MHIRGEFCSRGRADYMPNEVICFGTFFVCNKAYGVTRLRGPFGIRKVVNFSTVETPGWHPGQRCLVARSGDGR